MSYPHYPPPTGHSPYPYTYPAAAYSPTPGAYPYQTPGAYPYGTWPYPYSYFPQHPHTPHAPVPRPQAQTPAPVASTNTATAPIAPPATQAAVTPVPVSAPSRQTTFTSYTPASFRESSTAAGTGGATSRGSRKQSNLKGLFSKELRNLMYGFGDDRNPANDTVAVMEEILIEYITDVCQNALAPTRKSRLSIEDLRRALANPADAKKLARMEELLFMQEDIKRARAQFEESDIKEPPGY
ncbi:hypothetical protein JAAARDRAFT_31757 [Jaapia argillacea MUCL 33604]|uniref:Transcription initiation factor TFIID subunit 13 n=1 Tax=Jaapia argillacea MUCL 33604 TaxID=933084 RepID=A0A067QB95_9AGAM|nr:hypothetical protein JAAARDRAFT_31757 [Jaapia argillacea MUCL 33604]